MMRDAPPAKPSKEMVVCERGRHVGCLHDRARMAPTPARRAPPRD